ncbi:MAG: toprim domain-containing protein [Defluviitaleaceae bacterium]|nr:toprim domain-containing protein [Defluviitaleaceae bacterium]
MTNDKKREYNNESISQLKGADRVRLRPSVIFGSDGLTGCQHSIFEIISNSIDEAREGFGDRIEVILHTDGSISNIDYGRGIPVDYNNAEQKFNWELVFCELYAGGKYNNNDSDNYQFSLGLNGLGLCSTQYASRWMDVEIYRDNHRYTLRFERGENVGGLQKEPCDAGLRGTSIRWKPDDEVFKETDVPLEFFQDMLKKQAIVNPHVTFVLTHEQSGGEFVYHYPAGIAGYVEELTSGENFTPIVSFEHETKGRDRADLPEYRLKFYLNFTFDNHKSTCQYFHNSSFLEYGGSPERAVKLAFTSAIDAYIKNAGGYKKDEKKITFADIEDSLVLISSSFSTVTSYENQTKKAINNKFIQDAMADFLKKQLSVHFVENKADADKIVAQVLINKRSRESAEKTRLSIKKKLTGGVDFTNRAEKFVNCRTKDITRRELYIVEGDSALGACKLARDAEFQAIMPVRGKILNCLKADYARIFASDIIMDLIRVLGCGVEVNSKHNKDLSSFDMDKLVWSKIIICTDADYDGFQIRTLILTMLYRLTPQLITEKKVYIAESPLYEITVGDDIFFAYSDAEKNAITKGVKGKVHIQRSKGLGENEPDMLWQTTMSPATRKLVQVLPEDVAKTQEMFEVLLGDNIKGRKQFIEDHGHRYLEMADIN